MQIDKRSRSDLKQWFAANAIPTDSNFADLIDGMLNQKDDGIAKLPNDALSIEAAGDATSQKKAIHFYNSFADADPTWVLSLNPRQNPADAATAQAGFSVSDSAGNSRLFIERSTGRLGVGTLEPKKKLHVQGATSGPFLNDQLDRPGIAISGHYPEISLFSNVNNGNHGPTLRLGSYSDATASTFKQWVIGTAGRNASFLDIGFSDKNDSNPHAGIRNANGKTILTLKENGLVGIGTIDPVSDLTLRRDGASVLGPVLTLFNASGGAGAGGAVDFNGYNVGTNLPSLRLQSLDDGNFSSHLVIYSKTPGAAGNGLVERMRVSSTGDVSFTGAIVPSVGNSAGNGIQFPRDPGGGSGDEAFIRYFPTTGEACKLLIGINNDANDVIGFWQAGAERMTVMSGGIKVNGGISGGETTTGWALGRGHMGPDHWLRLTTAPGGSTYHDLAVNTFWAAGATRFDLAEVTPVNADDRLEQGDVVVIDREQGTRVRRSARPYDPAVYGIVSSYDQAAMVIGGFGGPEQMKHDKGKLPIALVGRVKVKVTAENGPIRVGDLLTSSSTPGHAMRCPDPAAHPGAIAGKALEPLSGGTGVITALVTLQ